MTTQPQLSMNLMSFAAEDPGGWDALVTRAVMLDSAGVDRLVISDHVVFGERLDEYGRPEIGGQAGGLQPTGPDGHWLEPLTTLSFLAAVTQRIRLGTNILLAALRRPAVLAKSLATLDVLSRGRIDLGVGVGWQREEYDTAGLAFEDRGRLLDHTLEVCQVLWNDRRAAYDAPELHFDGIHMMPKPLQAGGVPIWVSGTVNARVAHRIARFGAGWIPWGEAADDVESSIDAMRHTLDAIGHDSSGLQIVGKLTPVKNQHRAIDLDRTMEAVPPLIEAGVTDVRAAFSLPSDDGAALELLQTAVAAFRAVTK